MKFPICNFVWFDGKIIPLNKAQVPITTHAIHYGTSIFEGIRAYWNGKNLNIFRLEDHIKRFRQSGKFYSINLKFSDKDIIKGLIELCKKNKMKKSCYLRPFYFVGEYGINLHVTENAPTHVAAFMFPFGDLFNKKGISLGVSSWRKFSDQSAPPLAKMGGNYLNSILATRESKINGYDEALLLDLQGNVSEAPGENIFLVRENQLITPSLDSSALEGITRDSILQFSQDLDLQVSSRQITRSELYLADEMFLTGTAAEITPVTTIDKRKIGTGKLGKVTKLIMEKYNQIIMNKEDNYSNWLTPVY